MDFNAPTANFLMVAIAKIGLMGVSIALALLFVQPASAAEYYHKKWFDFPDLTTAPRFSNSCAKWVKTNSFKCSGFKCRRTTAKICVNPLRVKVALLRRDVHVVVSGPDTAQAAVRRAVEGFAAGCAVAAMTAGAPGPQTVAAPGTFIAAF